ncbi:MAG: hypothetical protein ACYDAG_14005 [Chloroflexota bacterium]
MSDDVLRQAYPWDEYELARSLVHRTSPGEIESELFAGIRDNWTLTQT